MALQIIKRDLKSLLEIKCIIPSVAYMSDMGKHVTIDSFAMKPRNIENLIHQLSVSFVGKFYGKVDLSRLESKNRKGARRPRLVKDLTPEEIKKIKDANTDWRPYYKEETKVPISPLGRNPHPVSFI